MGGPGVANGYTYASKTEIIVSWTQWTLCFANVIKPSLIFMKAPAHAKNCQYTERHFDGMGHLPSGKPAGCNVHPKPLRR